MRITENLKELVKKAQADGYKRIFSSVGQYKETEYCDFYDMKWILNAENGRLYGGRVPQRWAGHPNTRHQEQGDIQYSRLFRNYATK